MNAVEIADAVADLFAKPLDAAEFPFEFLQAFGNKEVTLKRLRKGDSNASDVPGGVLQRNNVHLAVCSSGEVSETLKALKASPKTAAAKAKFALATDGEWLAAENLREGEALECAYAETPNHVGFFLELGGISTVREIKDNPIDIRATGRLNKLYLELLNANEAWRAEARRSDLNHFFARLIFCFFAEDTHIFHGEGLFTRTVEQMTESDGSNTAYVVGKAFEAMNLSLEARKAAVAPHPGVPRVEGVVPPPAPVPRPSPINQGATGKGDDRAPSPVPATNLSDTGDDGTAHRSVQGATGRGDGRTPSPVPSRRDSSTGDDGTSHRLTPGAPDSRGSTPVPDTGGDRTNHRSLPVAPLPLWAEAFPYVNGDLFSGSLEAPRFTRLARSYLLRAGELNWREINPDIFGSMIQAVADDEERGALGMHYTSVPNIRKVLDPLFLDDLRSELERAGDSPQKLLNLRKRMARIRVFDPACGSGNFLVVAYRQMREIEAEVNLRRREADRPSDIPLTNFRGIEIRDFAAEVARLALIIAEYQADVRHRGERLALAEFLPLQKANWIWKGNALRLDWTTVCPPTGDVVRVRADNLFEDRLEQTEMDFANAGGETYLCSNPPYKGYATQTPEQKAELREVLQERSTAAGMLDYVAGWFVKAADYSRSTKSVAAFVATNSICQGQSVSALWPVIYATGAEIQFAHTSFKWANLASYNAGVTVAIVGIGQESSGAKKLYVPESASSVLVREGTSITPYLTFGKTVVIEKRRDPLSGLALMDYGSKPTDGGHLLMNMAVGQSLVSRHGVEMEIVRPFYGSEEFINGLERRCLWIDAEQYEYAARVGCLQERFDGVSKMRRDSPKLSTQRAAVTPFKFEQVRYQGGSPVTIVPSVSSERREWFPVGYLKPGSIVSNLAFALYDAPLWNLALIASRMHLVWIGTVCGKLKTDYRYSNTLGWNTFPVPPLTEKNREDLTRCAEEILLARERHFPATIADLYAPDAMPEDLRRAHERNDETLEEIYIGRRFRNDTERLEELFRLYTAMTAQAIGEGAKEKKRKGKARKATADESLL